MARFTVRLENEDAEWVESQAETRDRSQAWVLRQAVRCVRGAESVYAHRDGAGRTAPHRTDADLADAVRDLAERVEALEANVERLEQATDLDETETTPDATEALTDASAGSESDAIEQALNGWEYGRTEDEQRANRELAAAALEWLCEYGGAAKKSDVPLDELAEKDSLDREAESLWTQVIRDAFKRGVEQGVVDQPDYRSYEWVG